MQDPVEVRVRIERMVARLARRDDYGRLLARGEVIRRRGEVQSPEAWRVEMRRQARADRIKIRTGADRGVLWALLVDGESERRRAERDRFSDVLRVMVPTAVRSDTSRRWSPETLMRRCSVATAVQRSDRGCGDRLLRRSSHREPVPR